MAAAAATASAAVVNCTRQQQQQAQLLNTKIETISFQFPRAANAIRLISSPGLGALACGELWAGGKYKRHKSSSVGSGAGRDVEQQHRFTLQPGLDADEREGFAAVGSQTSLGSHDGSGARWCGCARYDAWEAITGPRWEFVGVGRAEDGRWVVKLWEGER